MTQSETRYEIMEGEDEEGFTPSGLCEWTLERPKLDCKNYVRSSLRSIANAFICEVVTTRLTARYPEVNHELQTIPTAG